MAKLKKDFVNDISALAGVAGVELSPQEIETELQGKDEAAVNAFASALGLDGASEAYGGVFEPDVPSRPATRADELRDQLLPRLRGSGDSGALVAGGKPEAQANRDIEKAFQEVRGNVARRTRKILEDGGKQIHLSPLGRAFDYLTGTTKHAQEQAVREELGQNADVSTPENFVRSLASGGAERKGAVDAVAGAVNTAVSPVRRSALGKLTTGIVAAGGPSAIIRAGKGAANLDPLNVLNPVPRFQDARDAADASQFSGLVGAASEGELDAAKANAAAGLPLTQEEQVAIDRDNRGIIEKATGAVGDIWSEFSRDPVNFVQQQTDAQGDLVNLGLMAASGGAAALRGPARAGGVAAQAGRIPKPKIPLSPKVVLPWAAEVGAMGAIGQAANEGRVTTEGVVGGIPVAAGMSLAGRALGYASGRLAGGRRGAAEGGAAARPDNPAPPVAPAPDATAAPVAPDAGAPPVEDLLPQPVAPDVLVPNADGMLPAPVAPPMPAAPAAPAPKGKGKTGAKGKTRASKIKQPAGEPTAIQLQSQLESARREAQYFSDAGDAALAKDIIDKNRPLIDALHGPDAQRATEAIYKDMAETTARRRERKASKPPAPPPEPGKTAEGAPIMDPDAARKKTEEARREAQHYARNGEPEVAKQIIDDAADAFKARYGERAGEILDTEKRIVDKQVPAKKAERKPASKPVVPASVDEAVKIVQESQDKINEAVAAGDPEAVDAAAAEASEAMKVVHPEGDVAAQKTQEVVEEAKARIEQQAVQEPEAPPAAPEPVQPQEPAAQPVPKEKKPKAAEDPFKVSKRLRGKEPNGSESTERLTVKAGGKTIKFSSDSDYAENPITAGLNDWRSVALLDAMATNDPNLASNRNLISGLRSDNGLRKFASRAIEEHNGRTYADLAEEGSNILYDDSPETRAETKAQFEAFLQENNLTPQQFSNILVETSLPQETLAKIGAAKEILKYGASKAHFRGVQALMFTASLAGLTARLLGVDDHGMSAASIPLIATTPEAQRAIVSKFAELTNSVGEAARKGAGEVETRANRLDRFIEERVKPTGNKQAIAASRDINLKTRRSTAESDIVTGELVGPVRQAAEGLSTNETSAFGQLGIPLLKDPNKNDAVFAVTDFLEGKMDGKNLSPAALELAQKVRDAFDWTRRKREELTGEKGLDNYVPRIEDQRSVFLMMNEANRQYGDGPFINNEATRAIASKIAEPDSPAVRSAIDNQTEALSKGIEVMPDGTLALVMDKNGEPVLKNEAYYLWMLDDDNGNPMKPHLPEIFDTKTVTDKNGEPVTVPVLKNDATWTKESLNELLRAESLRLILRRADVDPDAPRTTGNTMSNAFKSKRWQLDGSLVNRRVMPYLGDQFYNRNILDIVARTIPRQVRGLSRIETWGRDRRGILRRMQRIREAIPESQVPNDVLGMVREKDGSYRLATIADGDVYKNSIMRDLDDAAMGYARPFMDATFTQRLGRISAEIARFPLLLGRTIPAVNDLIYQQASAANLGLGLEFARQRLGVMGNQFPSGLRALGSSALEGAAIAGKAVGADEVTREAAASIRRNDAMWEYFKAGLTDPTSILGSTPGERMLVQAQRILGAFSRNAEGGDIAARLTAIEWLKGWAAEAKSTGVIRSGDKANVLTEAVHRTLHPREMREMLTLIDEQGNLVDEAAARRMMQIAAPFAQEIASQINGSSSPFLQPRLSSSVDAKNWAFMIMVPLALASAAASNVARGARGGRSGLGKVASVAGRTSRLAATSAAGSLAKTGIMATHPLLAASLVGILSGSTVPMGIAALTTGALKDPDNVDIDNARAKASWEYLQAIPDASVGEKVEAVGRLTATGLPYFPRILDYQVLPGELEKLGGFKYPGGTTGAALVGSTLEPGTSALIDEIRKKIADASLAAGLAEKGDYGDALQLFAASTFLPTTREMIAGKVKKLRKGDTRIDKPESMRDRVETLQRPGAKNIMIQQKRQKKLDQIEGMRMIRGEE